MNEWNQKWTDAQESEGTPTISIHFSRVEPMSIARDQASRIPKPERQDITHSVGTIGKMVYAQNARESR